MPYLLNLIVTLLGVLLIVTLVNLLTAPRLQRAPAAQSTPFVSLLIPARNEAAKLEHCLRDLLAQDYAAFEILVLNDDSTDDTQTIAQRIANEDARVRVFEGAALPPGWLGKNWACHQLSQQARGEVIIFTDADLRYAPRALGHTVGWMQQYKLGMLSAFSQHVTLTLPEKLIVPLLDMFVYSYLPLWLTNLSREPALAAANGHWLAFTREAYSRCGGHEHVRGEVVEDVELMRQAKRAGERVLTVCGKGEILGRMYENPRGIWEGYSKNLFGLVRFNTAAFFLMLILLATIHLLPYALVWFGPLTKLAMTAIAMNVLLRFLLALGYGHPIFTSVMLHPFAVAGLIAIGVNSFRWQRAGRLKWKGRVFSAEGTLR